MNKFIKLTNGIILNPRFIQCIKTNPVCVTVSMSDYDIKGYHFFSFGIINTSKVDFIFFQKTDKINYDKIMEWVENNSQ